MSTSSTNTTKPGTTWQQAIRCDPEQSAVYQSQDQTLAIAIQNSVTGFDLVYMQRASAASAAEVEALLKEWGQDVQAGWLPASEAD